MQYAYLDASNNVVGTSQLERTLEEAQGVNPAIESIVAGAPDEVVHKGAKGMLYFHQIVSGSGTMLEDYVEVPYIEEYRAAKVAAIDARTLELLGMGFTHGAVKLSCSDSFAIIYLGGLKMIDLGLITWPMAFATVDGKPYTIMDAADFQSIFLGAANALMTIRVSGTLLRNAVLAATTKADIDAVVDTRVPL